MAGEQVQSVPEAGKSVGCPSDRGQECGHAGPGSRLLRTPCEEAAGEQPHWGQPEEVGDKAAGSGGVSSGQIPEALWTQGPGTC